MVATVRSKYSYSVMGAAIVSGFHVLLNARKCVN